jgi:hypothetical protein
LNGSFQRFQWPLPAQPNVGKASLPPTLLATADEVIE